MNRIVVRMTTRQRCFSYRFESKFGLRMQAKYLNSNELISTILVLQSLHQNLHAETLFLVSRDIVHCLHAIVVIFTIS